MSLARKVPLVIVGASVACFAFPPAAAIAASPQVRNIRKWTAPDHTRIVVDLDRTTKYKVRVLNEPHRLVVDIPSGRLQVAREPVAVEDGLVRRVRVNQLRSGAQVVLDLYRAPEYKVFALEEYRDKPNRIVLDVFRPVPPAREAPSTAWRRSSESGNFRVVIDAGHGGEDPGATRGRVKEKEIALRLARHLAASIDSIDGMSAVLTRTGDYFIPLAKRTRLARELRGDIFLSLHLNSAPRRSARGMEIFFLSTKGATDKASQVVADRENASDFVGGIPPTADDDVFSILVDMKQTRTMNRSSVLAEELLTSVKNARILPVRDVKQAGFAVLKDIEMPSVILEVGFITNSEDTKILLSDSKGKKLAAILARGAKRYFEQYPENLEQLAQLPLIHRVRRGDTLWSIARTYGVSVAQLRSLNAIGSSDVLPVGKDLMVRK